MMLKRSAIVGSIPSRFGMRSIVLLPKTSMLLSSHAIHHQVVDFMHVIDWGSLCLWLLG